MPGTLGGKTGTGTRNLGVKTGPNLELKCKSGTGPRDHRLIMSSNQ